MVEQVDMADSFLRSSSRFHHRSMLDQCSVMDKQEVLVLAV
jgi:hypothetical protein